MHILLYISVLLLSVESLMFNLDPNNRKCLKEEIHKGVLVTGEYEVSFSRITGLCHKGVLVTGEQCCGSGMS
jgi:hypothetical protein